ncbi:MAG: polyprenyl synthetase family protein [Patescibacteria group bacterium]
MDFLPKYRAEIDCALLEFFARTKFPEKKFAAALRHAVLLGGKRIRPILGLLAFESIKNSQTKIARSKVIRILLSLELIHAFSLVHDDLPAIDDDTLRRGRPTVWYKFGEANAILAGDALVLLAFQNLAENAPTELLPQLTQILARASGGMIVGQFRDLDLSKNNSLANILKTHSAKTGELIFAAVQLGALLASADSAQTKLLKNYAAKLGLVFQIKDDLLDALGDPKILGKKVGKDVGKKGFVKILGILKSQKKLAELTRAAITISQKLKAPRLAQLAEFVLKREQ